MSARLTILLGLDNGVLLIALLRRTTESRSLIIAWPEMDEDNGPMHPMKHGDRADAVLPATLLTGDVTVCTHSDVFVLRVRRRIAEGTHKPEDVALVWVEPDGTEKPIPLNDRGTPAWWPKGVNAEAQDEFGAIRRALHARDAVKEGSGD